MDELIKNYNNYVCFTFYENEQSCVITVYNRENVLCQKIVSEEEGRKNLVTFCLFHKYLEPVPHLDTVALINSDKARGFVRYMKSQDIIKDLKHDLIPNFLCEFLEILQEQYKKIKIDYGYGRYSNIEMNLSGISNEEKNFYFIFQMDIKRYFSYTISQYMKKHESMNIQYAKEDINQIVLDDFQFPIELLNKEQQEYFMEKIEENKNARFIQFLNSAIGQNLKQTLEKQDSMHLIRTNPNKEK